MSAWWIERTAWTVTAEHFLCLPSTQTYSRHLIHQIQQGHRSFPPNQWHWVTATAQEAGQGQRGAIWQSPPGGLYQTVLFCWPATHQATLRLLSLAGALSIAQTLESYGLSPTLKWMNDVMVEGQKIAGVLGEVWPGTPWVYGLLGMGVNVHTLPTVGQPTTALQAHHRSPISLSLLAQTLQDHLYQTLCTLFTHPHSIIEAINQRLFSRGKDVYVRAHNQLFHGKLEGISPSGALIVDGRFFFDAKLVRNIEDMA